MERGSLTSAAFASEFKPLARDRQRLYSSNLPIAADALEHHHLKKTWEKVNPAVADALSALWLTAIARLCYVVHGSLARAGKVKSQTPKVEKQEKKKVPKGRAKKRILYNRRCVTVVYEDRTFYSNSVEL